MCLYLWKAELKVKFKVANYNFQRLGISIDWILLWKLPNTSVQMRQHCFLLAWNFTFEMWLRSCLSSRSITHLITVFCSKKMCASTIISLKIIRHESHETANLCRIISESWNFNTHSTLYNIPRLQGQMRHTFAF